ncbi:hypothetical protein GCK32_012476, partial [Trichostrongylus colubriformis]
YNVYSFRDDSASLNSVSINLNSTKDHLLDLSLTSNPTADEPAAVESTMLKDINRPSSRPVSPHDLPPPPPELATSSSRTFTSSSSSSKHEQKTWQPTVTEAIVPAHILHNVADSPVHAPPPKVTPPQPPFGPPVGSGAGKMFMPTTEQIGNGVSLPSSGDPLPPPPAAARTASTKSGCSSREDLLSEQTPSRATVREIPVLRTSSTAPTAVLEYKMPGLKAYHHGDVQVKNYVIFIVATRICILCVCAIRPKIASRRPVCDAMDVS